MHDSFVVGNLLGDGRNGLLALTGRKVFSFRLRLHPTSHPTLTKGCFPRVKLSGRETGRSLLSNIMDKNACSCASNHI